MKPEIEFTSIGSFEWTVCQTMTYLEEKILARTPEKGVVTRLLRFPPGTDTSADGTLSHEFWEEVYILEGDLTDLRLHQTFGPGHFAVRPPGMAHGPWRTQEGCLTFEVRYSMQKSGSEPM